MQIAHVATARHDTLWQVGDQTMRIRFFRVASLGTTICALGASVSTVPVAPVRPVADTYFGETVVDPYRWMEQAGPDFIAWLKAQDAVARGELKALPGYTKLRRDIAAAVDAEVEIAHIQRVGKTIYFTRRGPGEAQPSLYRRALAGGPEQRLVDPVALGGATTAINEYAVSPDNHLLAYSLAAGGSEEAVLHILDLRNGKALPETIDRARFAGPVWSDGGDWLFYDRLKQGGTGADRFSDQTIFRHRPGKDPAGDEAVFSAASVGSALGRQAFVGLQLTPGSAYALASSNSGTSPNSEWYVAKLEELVGTGAPKPRWNRLASLADDVDAVAVRGDTAWVSSFRTASRRTIQRLDFAHPDLTRAPVVVPEQAGVVKMIAAAADALYVASAEPTRYTLTRVEDDGARQVIALPDVGTVAELAADPRVAGAVFSLESWVRPKDYDLATDRGALSLALTPPYPIDLSPLVTDTVSARAPDGTVIPITVSHLRDLKRNGSNIALIDAYGAYGVAADPFFNSALVPFMLRGGVFAEAHVRGGGEFGETWHLAGKGLTKPNTWRDFIASVEELEHEGFTAQGRVAGMGVSAGGIMIGRTVTERPDLLAAAIMWAPTANMLRFETTEGGPANVAEFGSVATPEGYKALRAMDSYSHVVSGASYPAILVTAGINDHRVPVWMPAKLAARLQAATGSGRPVRLRVDFSGGHHVMGTSKDDLVDQATDTIAFVLHATGAPGF